VHTFEEHIVCVAKLSSFSSKNGIFSSEPIYLSAFGFMLPKQATSTFSLVLADRRLIFSFDCLLVLGKKKLETFPVNDDIPLSGLVTTFGVLQPSELDDESLGVMLLNIDDDTGTDFDLVKFFRELGPFPSPSLHLDIHVACRVKSFM
jgi:hypothetical protein